MGTKKVNRKTINNYENKSININSGDKSVIVVGTLSPSEEKNPFSKFLSHFKLEIILTLSLPFVSLLSSTPITSEDFKMPDLIGMTYDNAVHYISESNVDIKLKREDTYSTSDKKDKILKQSVQSGKILEKDKRYDLAVTVGIGGPIVPECYGKTLSKAKQKLKKVGLKWKVKKQYSDSMKKNLICKQSVSGRKVEPHTVIILTVSLGKKPVSVKPKNETLIPDAKSKKNPTVSSEPSLKIEPVPTPTLEIE